MYPLIASLLVTLLIGSASAAEISRKIHTMDIVRCNDRETALDVAADLANAIKKDSFRTFLKIIAASNENGCMSQHGSKKEFMDNAWIVPAEIETAIRINQTPMLVRVIRNDLFATPTYFVFVGEDITDGSDGR